MIDYPYFVIVRFFVIPFR